MNGRSETLRPAVFFRLMLVRDGFRQTARVHVAPLRTLCPPFLCVSCLRTLECSECQCCGRTVNNSRRGKVGAELAENRSRGLTALTRISRMWRKQHGLNGSQETTDPVFLLCALCALHFFYEKGLVVKGDVAPVRLVDVRGVVPACGLSECRVSRANEPQRPHTTLLSALSVRTGCMLRSDGWAVDAANSATLLGEQEMDRSHPGRGLGSRNGWAGYAGDAACRIG